MQWKASKAEVEGAKVKGAEGVEGRSKVVNL
jgi:hypothetical protein